MKSVNIYTLTRLSRIDLIQKMERQMSKRGAFMKMKSWEIDSLRAFTDSLEKYMQDMYSLEFYYSFVMPKLGKEFDLLRIGEDSIVNVELKSREIPDEQIRRQLVQNQYYLGMLGKAIHSYTYISENDRLVRLTNSGKLVETEWEHLAQKLTDQMNCYEEDIEDLFKEEQYLISPLTDPDRFFQREYFLTSQQNDIKRHILRKIEEGGMSLQGFTGLPGTGKTILLYDLAMRLSKKQKVCILHLGSWPEELGKLNERLKRIDFYYYDAADEIALQDNYGAVLVDEGHRLSGENLDGILSYAARLGIPVIFSYDCEEILAEEERGHNGAELIEVLPGYVKYRLTNRIRVNRELSSFVSSVMQIKRGYHRPDFPSVELAYANHAKEAEILLAQFRKEGYQYIYDSRLTVGALDETADLETGAASGREFDQVVMLVDASFSYDEEGSLRSDKSVPGEDSIVRCLFHGLSRAKKKIALVVLNNELLMEYLLEIVQRNITK